MGRFIHSTLFPVALLVLAVSLQAQTSSTSSGGSISGRVTVSGQAFTGAAIILEPYDSPGAKTPLPRAITNDQGEYKLAGVPEGRYTVKPVAPALVIARGPDSDKAGTGISSGLGFYGFIVSVAKGDTVAGIDFALEPGGVITGRVTDDSTRPVVAVSVDCERVNEQGQLIGASSSRFQTDDRGIYRIYGLPTGKYLVSVSDFGRFPPRHDRRIFYPDAIDRKRATVVEVTAGKESTDIDVRLGHTQLTYSITGSVVGQDTGKPVAGVSVGFIGWNDGRNGYITTDLNGKFKIEECVNGGYELKIGTTGATTQGYYSEPLVIQVSDADVTDVEVNAVRGAIVSGRVIISGAEASVVAGAFSQAAVIATNLQPGLRGSQISVGATRIEPDGRFEFTGLRPAKIALSVSFPQGFTLLRIERDGLVLRDGLAVSAGERIAGLRLVVGYGTGSINGQIKVEGGVLPTRMQWLLNVRRVDGDGEVLYQMIDARGHFWVRNLVPGLYEITAQADYVEIPGVTPSQYPSPIKQTVTVAHKTESQVVMILDLKAR